MAKHRNVCKLLKRKPGLGLLKLILISLAWSNQDYWKRQDLVMFWLLLWQLPSEFTNRGPLFVLEEGQVYHPVTQSGSSKSKLITSIHYSLVYWTRKKCYSQSRFTLKFSLASALALKKKKLRSECNFLRNTCCSRLPLSLYTLTAVCIFSMLLSIHFLWYWLENLLNNQELLKLVIISSILMTSMFDSSVIW